MNMKKRKPLYKTLIFSFLILLGFSFWGCAPMRKEIYIPLNPEADRLPIYRKFSVEAGLLISEEDKNFVYKGTPSGPLLSNIVHVFPLGAALEKDSVQIFSQVFRKIQVVRTPAEAQKFKIVIAPQIEDFSFRYDEAKGYYLRAGDTPYIAPTAAIKVKITIYSEGTRIWEKGVKSPEKQKPSPYPTGFIKENEMGEVVSQALNDALARMAEEIAQDPEVEKNAASLSIDGLAKPFAQREGKPPFCANRGERSAVCSRPFL
jgi:hypothetical protein